MKKETTNQWNIKEEEVNKMRAEVLNLILDSRKPEASEIITNEFMEKNHVYTTRNDKMSEIWIYKDGIYVPQGRTYINEFCRLVLGDRHTTFFVNQIISKIEADTFVDIDEFFSKRNVNEIAVLNGILNIFSGELTYFTPDKIFFNKLPVEYEPSATCPNIIDHFSTVLRDELDSLTLFELFGYSLLKDYRIAKAFMWVGGGRNGKGITLELMKLFLGPDNCVDIPIQKFEEDVFATGELFNKMANLAGDISDDAIQNASILKHLTGSDLVSAQRKFLPMIHFVNYAKMIFSCNAIPNTREMTYAFWSRWIVLEFPYTFMTKKELEKKKKSVPKEEHYKYKLKNINILKKLTTPKEMSGLLNMALNNLSHLLKNQEFHVTMSTEEVKNFWIRNSHSFMAFANECLIESYGSRMVKQVLKKEYFAYCRKYKIRPESDRAVKYYITKEFAAMDSQAYMNKERVYVWEGIDSKQRIIERKEKEEKEAEEKMKKIVEKVDFS